MDTKSLNAQANTRAVHSMAANFLCTLASGHKLTPNSNKNKASYYLIHKINGPEPIGTKIILQKYGYWKAIARKTSKKKIEKFVHQKLARDYTNTRSWQQFPLTWPVQNSPCWVGLEGKEK